ncbi:transcriptional repressor [Anaerosalibacter bizertensis]|uniref:Transcriptional repressor n=1 Tax=Anaerosalibacter bizertensis TaxID=932217 RepID=A0A9Q4AAU5_9FIRM|nr:Fur family transcriptional regulator [Anaerosalibacter bizertensis]MBV1818167.1 transcriptional repressor [Bacteroidales bacterium MSK.15.36]MCB5558431.1 transcriptional repressor [Anaerosalibacter bizertensis]MCG4564195.1 transcriptional repressor [Anaerosalibacter bizertensis]MCG4582132.1 transcriptional repressor [Anaerosalibacter bizertensis]MCG4585521.1 transcriptional repressor [Anaerosalibacter bizertensis]
MDINVDSIKERLKEEGYKLTTQRRAILDAIIENSGSHLSPEEIYEVVKLKYPEIGLATVYRTLQLFEQLDIVCKLNFDDGCNRYELNSDSNDHHHHHLICLNCGKVIEVKLDLLENLEYEIEREGKFKIVDHNVKFFGYCIECRDK